MRSGAVSMLRSDVSALMRSASSEPVGADLSSDSGALSHKTGFQLVAQGGQFRLAGVVNEGLDDTVLVIAELRLCDGQVLANPRHLGSKPGGEVFAKRDADDLRLALPAGC